MKRKIITLQTERLIMRPISLDDVHELYQLNLDPEVIQYTGDVAFESLEATMEFYKAYNQYELYGMGRFSTYIKETNEFIGWCGLKKIEQGVIDLGYRFFKRHWNKGYATESSLASLTYGFEVLDITEIVAQAWIINEASVNVMQKLGMRFKQKLMYEGKPAIQYVMTRDQYKERKDFTISN